MGSSASSESESSRPSSRNIPSPRSQAPSRRERSTFKEVQLNQRDSQLGKPSGGETMATQSHSGSEQTDQSNISPQRSNTQQQGGSQPQIRITHQESQSRWQGAYQQYQYPQGYYHNSGQRYGQGGQYGGMYGVTQAAVGHQQQQQRLQYKEDDIVFETFYHVNGQALTCMYKNGQRYVLDSWQTQTWQPFPMQWYNQGTLVTNSVVKSDQSVQNEASSSSNTTTAGTSIDDREGKIAHPKRGKLHTYLFEEKRNVHCYYDTNSGTWMKMPVHWELYSPLVRQMVATIKDDCPEWKNEHDIIATLRACNYKPDDAIATFLAWDEIFDQSAGGTSDINIILEKDENIATLEKKRDVLCVQLSKSFEDLESERKQKQILESRVHELQEQLSSMEVEARTATVALEALQNQRPKTARPKTARPKTPQVEYRTEYIEIEKDTVDPALVEDTATATKDLHKSFLMLKRETQQHLQDLGKMLTQVVTSVMSLKTADSGQSKELQEIKELYRRETMQRKLLYNKLQELKGNIRVFCRCRYDDRVDCCHNFPSDQEVTPLGSKKPFSFDRVFTPQATQAEIFEDTLPIITSCVDGYNVCIMAYGQTGSGKTHTMMGPKNDPGVNIRSIEELLRICSEREKVQYKLEASMVEIYNETIQDLLSPTPTTLELRAQGNKINLPNLTKKLVESKDDIQKIMDMGDKNRSVASTKMNSTSSRSHLLFMISLEGRDKVSGAVSNGTLTLCDLAGSERIAKTEATGQRLVEAAAINKSLSALGQVFAALKSNQLHVPYRNSKLTHLLQPSLGGDAKACMFVNISPAESNVTESVSTLQFGSGAKQISLGQAKQNVKKAPLKSKNSNIGPANWDLDQL